MRYHLFLVLFFPFSGQAQINFQLGQAMTVGNNNGDYEVIYEKYNGSYYSDFRKIGTETFFKVSSYNPWDTSNFSVKYTLEFGLKYFNYYGSSTHIPTVDYLGDTPFDVGASNFYLRAFSWTNGVDFIYRINDKFTIINTLGLKVAAVNGGREEVLWGSGRRLRTYDLLNEKLPISNPMISIIIAPQLLINLKGFSLGLHLNQDLLMVNSVMNTFNNSQTDLGKVQLSAFTSFGISIMPNLYLIDSKEPMDLEN